DDEVRCPRPHFTSQRSRRLIDVSGNPNGNEDSGHAGCSTSLEIWQVHHFSRTSAQVVVLDIRRNTHDLEFRTFITYPLTDRVHTRKVLVGDRSTDHRDGRRSLVVLDTEVTPLNGDTHRLEEARADEVEPRSPVRPA